LGVSVDIGELVSADLQFHIYPHHSMFTLYQRQTKREVQEVHGINAAENGPFEIVGEGIEDQILGG